MGYGSNWPREAIETMAARKESISDSTQQSIVEGLKQGMAVRKGFLRSVRPTAVWANSGRNDKM